MLMSHEYSAIVQAKYWLKVFCMISFVSRYKKDLTDISSGHFYSQKVHADKVFL